MDVDEDAAEEEEKPVEDKKEAKKDKKSKKEEKSKKENAPSSAAAPSPAKGSHQQTSGTQPVSAILKFWRENNMTVTLPSPAFSSADIPEDGPFPSSLPMSVQPISSFTEIDFVPKKVLNSVCKGFQKPTPIQAQCWRALSMGMDIVGIAETGSGKTLAFSLPMISHVLKSKSADAAAGKKGKKGVALPLGLVLAPTRELAMQTQDVLSKLDPSLNLRSVCVYGGVEKHAQRREFQTGTDMIVATPGRLLDFLSESAVDLSQVSYLVLDEADRMLDMNFERDIRQIMTHLTPKAQRQTVMFSATWPDSIRALASEFQNSPLKVTVGSEDLAACNRIKQIVEVIDPFVREKKVLELVKKYNTPQSRILVFALCE
jgi:ATP-dependent RNA helicase DBP3